MLTICGLQIRSYQIRSPLDNNKTKHWAQIWALLMYLAPSSTLKRARATSCFCWLFDTWAIVDYCTCICKWMKWGMSVFCCKDMLNHYCKSRDSIVTQMIVEWKLWNISEEMPVKLLLKKINVWKSTRKRHPE